MRPAPQLYIGLMSGTSMDAVDAVLVDFTCKPYQILATHCEPIPHAVQQSLFQVCHNPQTPLEQVAKLDVTLGKLFAQTCVVMMKPLAMGASDIMAIGSHGQTILHQPEGSHPFTLQIADPNIIATDTGITTVADFRRRDIALGGQGAPLTPLFHQHLFAANNQNMAVINIGGMANVTFLFCEPKEKIIAFDVGPGNVLLDLWIKQHLQQPFDHKGSWAEGGKTDQVLLQVLLSDPYFQKTPPKSTGREYFNLSWLEKYLKNSSYKLKPQDIQTTLTRLTAQTISDAIQANLPKDSQVILCGGGAFNHYLKELLSEILSGYSVVDSQFYAINPKWLESMAFAWLAKQTLQKHPVNLTSVTGSLKPTILGGVYFAYTPHE